MADWEIEENSDRDTETFQGLKLHKIPPKQIGRLFMGLFLILFTRLPIWGLTAADPNSFRGSQSAQPRIKRCNDAVVNELFRTGWTHLWLISSPRLSFIFSVFLHWSIPFRFMAPHQGLQISFLGFCAVCCPQEMSIRTNHHFWKATFVFFIVESQTRKTWTQTPQ